MLDNLNFAMLEYFVICEHRFALANTKPQGLIIKL